ncbi:hypothetical protein PIB30_091986 [Stylosanthes scabra]|uniref:Putative plant transposon protein domain-containing protein n=1 Tax=Stylosanthes scabra TaxID=79078 RepID=A0ABU6QV25_9FABA|nr:hypothetical protein [Stylosanthes scabra]
MDDDILCPISAQINQRKWQGLTKSFLMVGYYLVREFYANAWRLKEHKNQPPTYTTQIRGTEISFSPESINRVLKLKDTPLPNAASYHDRKELNGSIMPTTNRSEVNVERAVLIHAIHIGEDMQVDEIIAEQMYKFVNKTNTRSKLPFPSVIALLCKEAKVIIPGNTLIPQKDPIDGVAMGRVRGPREPRQNHPLEQKVEEEAPQQQHQHFQKQQNSPPDFMANFNNTMATMQQHYDQRWDSFQ